MIDIRCVCGSEYHADDSHIEKSLRCKECGRILRVERPVLARSNEPRKIERVTTPGEIARSVPVAKLNLPDRSRDRWIAVGISTFGIILLSAWLLLRQTRPEQAPAESVNTDKPAASSPKATPEIPKSSNLKISSPDKLSQVKPIPLLKVGPGKPPLKVERHLINEFKLPELSVLKTTPPLIIIPACAIGHTPEQPATGERIEADVGTSGKSRLEITNGQSVDAVARLVETSTNITSRVVYIRANDVYIVEGIEPGTYSLLFASGSDWVAKCGQFQRDEEIKEFDEPLVIEQNSEYRTTYKAFLNPVPFGNASTKKIDLRRFWQGDEQFSVR